VEVAVNHRWGLFTVGSTFFPAAAESDQDLINIYYTKMRDAGVAPEDITVAAVRNMYVASTDDEALDIMKPRLEWAGDMGKFLRQPASAMASAGKISGYEEYANDPFIDPAQAEKRAPEGMSAIGNPEKLIATVSDLESRHVNHFLGFMDTGGLSYDEIKGSMQLFAKEVMPHFK
jgi:alkanesulfonate monooxygenase SsuD/methylene tetrahydromethanopterin reductase-like flavin-dependent oxidoreductase (luciferase family)